MLAVTADLSAQSEPYRNAALPIEARVADLLARMTPEEKFWQLFMIPGSRDDPSHDYRNGAFGLQVEAIDSSRTAAWLHAARLNDLRRWFVDSTRLGIPIIPFDEALHGLTRPGATAFPQAIALAATWDTALMGEVAGAIAREVRSRGIRQVLSPVVNLTRDARWGRTEETYGEDVRLASAMGVAFVSAFERMGVIATPKHFVANVGEGGRDSWPVEVSERQLEEVWFPPFREAIHRGGARSVMTAYNSVDGMPASQNRHLLTDVLRGRWGFGGFVISDAAATAGATVLHHTEASVASSARRALEAGLDVVFQSSWEQHRPWLRAFTDGSVPDSLIDRAVARVLRAKFALGLFEDPLADPDSAARWNGDPWHRTLAREAAVQSLVLLRNNGTLPLREPGRVALIGVDADSVRLGGYSGPGNDPVSIRRALADRLGADRVAYLAGPGRTTSGWDDVPGSAFMATADGVPVRGLRADYFAGPVAIGTPTVSRIDPMVRFHWTFTPPAPGVSGNWFAVRWTGAISVPAGAPRRLAVEGDDGYRLWIDGELVLDRAVPGSWGRHATTRRWSGGQHAIRLEFHEGMGNGRIRLQWEGGDAVADSAAIIEATRLAASADVAVVVAGIEEGEFRDRASLRLPGSQEALIRAVAATGTPTVVVLIGGAPITMSPWLDEVAAVLMAWYPGEDGGAAIADVLLGRRDPGGRLPITFPMSEGQLPLYYDHKPTGRGDDYLDLAGRPLFPFGHGESYATFDYSGLSVYPERIAPGDSATVRFVVLNTGERAGTTVAQLYLRDELASIAQPVLSLRGWQKLHLAPGESREVRMVLGPDDLALLDVAHRRVVEPGRFELTVGISARRALLRGWLTVVDR